MCQLKNDRLLRTIWREPVDATPVWIMRQAGRYLPEYRDVRARAGSFMNLCKTPDLACEVTLQPIRRYDLDAAIIFSDILTIPDAMGLGLHFIENEGPHFDRPIRHRDDVHRLTVPDPEQLSYVYDTIRLVQHELAGELPLIGFCGSPWTLATYMVDGRFETLQHMLLKEASLLHKLLNVLAQSVSAHLNAQIKAGVQVAMIFDTWGGMLDTRQYEEYSLRYIRQAISGLERHDNNSQVPVILFTKGGQGSLEKMLRSGCDVIGVDWEISLKEARARVGTQVALQGNMHPDCLRESPEVIRRETSKLLDSFGYGSGHVFNLGHGITPDVSPEQVAVLVDAVHELSKPYHTRMNEK